MTLDPAPKPRWPRWAKLLLITSLAANLAVVGLVVGANMRGPIATADRMSLPIEGFRRVHRAMPGPDQAALRADLRDRHDRIRAHRKQINTGRRAFLAVLTAEPYSEADLKQILEGQAQSWSDISAEARALLLKRITAMTPEARTIFAQNLDRELKRRQRPRRSAD